MRPHPRHRLHTIDLRRDAKTREREICKYSRRCDGSRTYAVIFHAVKAAITGEERCAPHQQIKE